MTSSTIELPPRTSPTTRVPAPRKPQGAELGAGSSRPSVRPRLHALPAAVQFLLASLLAAAITIGAAAGFLALFDAWYGPQLAPALRGLGLQL